MRNHHANIKGGEMTKLWGSSGAVEIYHENAINSLLIHKEKEERRCFCEGMVGTGGWNGGLKTKGPNEL